MSPLLKTSIFSLVLAILKLGAFLFSGSMIVVASFVDSLTDSIVSYINHKTFILSRERADKEHPFGHGGFEVIATLLQGVVICGAGVVVVIESLSRMVLIKNQTGFDEGGFEVALVVMIFSAFVGLFLHKYLASQNKKLQSKGERSLSLESDDAHYLSDFIVNISGALGLVVSFYSQSIIVDGLFGLVGGLFVFKAGIPILRKSLSDILHTQVDPDEQQKFADIAFHTHEKVQGVHRLRSRRLGPVTFIDFHLKLPADLPLTDAHEIGEMVHRNLKKHFPFLDVLIHLDPDDEEDDDLFEPAFDLPKEES